jgi:hypothetical protein
MTAIDAAELELTLVEEPRGPASLHLANALVEVLSGNEAGATVGRTDRQVQFGEATLVTGAPLSRQRSTLSAG